MSISPRDSTHNDPLRSIDAAVDLLAGAIRRQMARWMRGSVPDEETLTAELVGAIAATLGGAEILGVDWEAIITSKKTEEPDLGADLVSLVSFDLPNFRDTKGFIAQAKRIRPGLRDVGDRRKLVSQCKDMLRHSPASFVFVYGQWSEIRVVPARAVVAHGGYVSDLNYLPLDVFYAEHFYCFFGDSAGPMGDVTQVETLRRE